MLSFDAWMSKVNAHLVRRFGLESADLPDCPYAVWHEEGWTPSAAAAAAVREAGFCDA